MNEKYSMRVCVHIYTMSRPYATLNQRRPYTYIYTTCINKYTHTYTHIHTYIHMSIHTIYNSSNPFILYTIVYFTTTTTKTHL